MDSSTVHNQILPVIRKAEGIALSGFGKSNKIHVKTGVASQAALVTEVDEKLDLLFREELKKIYPEFGFITEEGMQQEVKEYNWIIDPIDGTTNYSRNFQIFGISVALWKQNDPIYGCIALPKIGKIMYGWKNGGVYVNDEKIPQVSERTSLKPFVFLAPVAEPEDHGKIIKIIGETIAAPRDFGCSVYQCFETIAGNADLAVSYKLSLWDIGAAILLAQEIGLAVEFITPKPDIASLKDYSHTVVLGYKDLVEKLVKKLRYDS
jgi:myo-inositol-1(or 4)-monophosphatase